MEIVVKIPDDMIKSLEQGNFGAKYNIYDLVGYLMNGTPLPDINVGDLISRQSAEEKLKKVVDEMALIFADIREKNVDDSVCGLCEYDCDHGLDGYANECPGFERNDCFKLKEEYRREWTDLSDVSPVEPERKPGKWVHMVGWWECNQCHAEYTGMPTCMGEVMYKYCPMCGAKMKEVNADGDSD